MSLDRGERLKNARKRAGLTQLELAERCPDVSLSQLRRIERGEYEPRLYALRQLAVALRVRTADLAEGQDAEYADAETEALWEPVRRALVGHADAADSTVSGADVRTDLENLRGMLGTHRYGEVAALLPMVLRDAEDVEEQGRTIRSRVLNLTGWMLTQCRQFDTAEATLNRAIDAAEDRIDAAAAANTLAWVMLRQGRIADAREFAIRWADEIEPPRFSRATTAELSTWGRMWLYVANISVRNNEDGEAEDAMNLARAAAARIGREVYTDASTVRTFGPITVAHIAAEGHAIAGRPEMTLSIAERTPPATLQPVASSRLRHRLDVAHAHAQLGQFPEAIAEMQTVRNVAPEWLVQQQYGRDILTKVIIKRRTLTPETRELANQIRLEL
ncbi:helix-turn-helix domain-containing protein [Nocardia tengchongensis]|uniref:helix-turn-helix domain-containing protein n=1 Tax=Nocardia tengchongensis TaxID=2055889 RepID=UPI003697A360